MYRYIRRISMAMYVDEGLFPGSRISFRMTANGIDKSTIQNMMKKSGGYNMAQIKKVFEYFLGVSIADIDAEMKGMGRADRGNRADVKNDYQKALSIVKRMTTEDFFEAKMTAQRNGIVQSIAQIESLLKSSTLSSAERVQMGVALSEYKQDLSLWDSLHPDERLFFVVKSMADYETKNYSYYQNIEMANASSSMNTFDRLKNMLRGKSERQTNINLDGVDVPDGYEMEGAEGR